MEIFELELVGWGVVYLRTFAAPVTTTAHFTSHYQLATCSRHWEEEWKRRLNAGCQKVLTNFQCFLSHNSICSNRSRSIKHKLAGSNLFFWHFVCYICNKAVMTFPSSSINSLIGECVHLITIVCTFSVWISTFKVKLSWRLNIYICNCNFPQGSKIYILTPEIKIDRTEK